MTLLSLMLPFDGSPARRDATYKTISLNLALLNSGSCWLLLIFDISMPLPFCGTRDNPGRSSIGDNASEVRNVPCPISQGERSGPHRLLRKLDTQRWSAPVNIAV